MRGADSGDEAGDRVWLVAREARVRWRWGLLLAEGRELREEEGGRLLVLAVDEPSAARRVAGRLGERHDQEQVPSCCASLAPEAGEGSSRAARERVRHDLAQPGGASEVRLEAEEI